MNWKIVASKPRPYGTADYVVIDRGEGHQHRYVSATVTSESLNNNEWFWGHYFTTFDEAMKHFDGR